MAALVVKATVSTFILSVFTMGLTQLCSTSRKPGGKIGADPTLTGALTWLEWKKFFENQEKDLKLQETIVNPIDEVWMDQPSRPTDELEIHDVEFAGNDFRTSEDVSTLLFSELPGNHVTSFPGNF